MANSLKIVQFKSQKDINKEREEKLEKRKADLRRRIDVIKNDHTKRRGKVRA